MSFVNTTARIGQGLLLLTLFLCLSSAQCWAKQHHDKCKTSPNEYAYISHSGKIGFRGIDDRESDQFSDGVVAVRRATEHGNRLTTYINKNGKIVAQGFKHGLRFSEGLAAVGEFGNMRFIDKSGKVAFSQTFQDALYFREGLAPVMVNNGFGFIDRNGSIVIAPFFENTTGFSEGLAAVESQGQIGFISKTGEWRIKPRFTYVDGFSGGLALVRDSDREFFIDHEGRKVVDVDEDQRKRPFCYWHVSETGLKAGPRFSLGFNERTFANTFSFSEEGLSPMSKDMKYGYIDKSGKFVVPPKFNQAYPFVEGLARVCVDKKYGFIDKTGMFAVEPKFLGCEDFSEGTAAVAIGHNKWGYVDKQGKFVIKPKYMRAGSFHDGRAKVQLSGYYDDRIK